MSPTRRIALALALCLVAAPAWAQTAAAPFYVFLYKPGPAWLAGKPLSGQPLGGHGAYMKQLLDEGHLMAGGPTLDVDGGMAIVRAASADEAKAILAADPAVKAGVFTAEMHAWQPFLAAPRPLTP